MADLCIICGQKAGSREHLFPAALGGRRTNRGIYCGLHNQAFSPQAACMADQLRAINARLSVRPDHSSEPTRHVFPGRDGSSLAMSGDNIVLAEPHVVSETSDGTTRSMEIRFSNREEAARWLAEQRAAGNTVELSEPREQIIVQMNTEHIPIALGGSELFRALAYVATTFFAHHFKKSAQIGSLNDIKLFSLEGVGENFVWWEPPELMSDLPPNPFEFGHTIALSTSASQQQAHARISLFSALNFSIALGGIARAVDRTIITYLDPLANRPPNDMVVHTEERLLFTTSAPSVSYEHLQNMISNGRAQQNFQILFRRISRFNFDRDLRPVVEQLVNADQDARADLIADLLNAQSQRIMNLIRHALTPLRDGFAANSEFISLSRQIDRFITADERSANGLCEEATAALEVAKSVLGREISAHLDAGTLELDQLFMLLSGGPGAAMIGEAILRPLIESLR